jgi:hypothetical protein
MPKASWLFVLLVHGSLIAGSPCPKALSALGALARQVFPGSHRFDTSLYLEFLAQAKQTSPALGELTTPERLFAYRDSLTNSNDTFLDQVRTIEELGGRLVFKPFRQSTDYHFDGSFPFWSASPRNPLIRFSFGGSATLYSVDAAPKDQESLVSSIAYYSLCLASYRIAKATHYAAARDPDFTERGLHHLETAESHLYETLSVLNAPEALVTKILPDQTRYRAYLEGHLKEAIERDFRAALSRRWFYDRARDLVKGIAIMGIGTIVFTAGESVGEGKLESRLTNLREQIDSFVSAYAAKRIERGTLEYNESLKRPRPEVDAYESQIQALLREITSSGDPDGKLQAQVDDLNRRKALLGE